MSGPEQEALQLLYYQYIQELESSRNVDIDYSGACLYEALRVLMDGLIQGFGFNA